MMRRWLALGALVAGCAQVAAPDLDRSILGSQGLVAWLNDSGVPVETASPYVNRSATDLSLRIQPLLDSNLYAEDSELIGSPARQSLQDLDAWVMEDNLRTLPTLTILPKWRGGAMDSRTVHQNLLIGPVELRQLVAQVRRELRVIRAPGVVEAKPDMGEPLRIALFQPQLFARDSLGSECVEKVGLPQGALIVDCLPDGDRKRHLLLSDPDLMNNHGLAIAENARFARLWLADLQADLGGMPIYLDRLNRVSVEGPDAVAQAPQTIGFPPLLRWPLPIFWALGMALLLLAFWRGARRFGPPLPEDSGAVEPSKTAAIDAKARLLRLSGDDGRMVADYVRARMLALAAGVYGPPGANEAGVARLLDRLGARAPDLARDFARSARSLTDAPQGAAPYQELTRFRELLGKVKDELG